MNIEALTADLDAVFQRHGITGSVQFRLAFFLAMSSGPALQALFERVRQGAVLFAVDDAGSMSCGPGGPTPRNAVLLNNVLKCLSPRQLCELLEAIQPTGPIELEIRRCGCPQCEAARARSTETIDTTGSLN